MTLAAAQALAPAPSEEIAISARGIKRIYGSTVALADAELHVRAGEIHGLLGENGAGKSTLVRILAGVEQPDAGELSFFGSPATGGTRERAALGLSFIHQQLGLFDELSVADNIALGSTFPRRLGLIDQRATRERAQEIVERLGLDLDVDRLVGDLPLASQTSVAIARALSQGARLIVLDEPTAYLEAAQVRALFGLLARLREDGVAVVLISHRNEDILRHCDRVTVLRNGRTAAQEDTHTLTEADLIWLISGRQVEDHLSSGGGASAGATRLMVDELRGQGFGPVSFRVARGEILGICGLADGGQTALSDALSGRSSASSGSVSLDGQRADIGTVRSALQAGIACVPADRRRDGLIGEMTVSENLALDAPGPWWHLIDSRREAKAHTPLLTEYAVNPPQPERAISTFSGGNQQKVLMAKWLSRTFDVIVLNEPSAGVDIGAKADIHTIIRRSSRANETATIVVSSDFREIAELCDRAIVMRHGTIAAELPAGELDADRLTELAYGSAA